MHMLVSTASAESVLPVLTHGVMPKHIMLVISGRLFRNGIELVLREAGGSIIGDCETLEQSDALLRSRSDLQPDLFVIGMSATHGVTNDFARIRDLRGRYPDARWIILSNSGSPEFWREAIENRVDGLLHQDSPGEVLQLLVRLILLGYTFLPPALAMALAIGPQAGLPGDPQTGPEHPGFTPARPDPVLGPALGPVLGDFYDAPARDTPNRWRASLSDRESDILRGLVAGQSNKLIARELSISEATVKVHVKALLRKMQVTNRTQAAISALQYLRAPAAPDGRPGPNPAPNPAPAPPGDDDDR